MSMDNTDAKRKQIERKFNEFYCPKSADYYLWIDRQVRPTVGTTVNKGMGKDRVIIGDKTFSDMFHTLTSAIENLIPQFQTDVCYSYSVGTWLRSGRFVLKANLTTDVFLSLTDELRKRHIRSLRHNPFSNPPKKEELEKRQQQEYRRAKLNEFSRNENRIDLQSRSTLHIATVRELDYPLLCLYETNRGRPTAGISALRLPEALTMLETFISEDWEQQGYCVNMIPVPDPEGASPTSRYLYQVTASVHEEEYAHQTGKDPNAVKESWGRMHGVGRQYYACDKLKN